MQTKEPQATLLIILAYYITAFCVLDREYGCVLMLAQYIIIQ